MRSFLAHISWETEVWIAEAPDHLIHFNGERFLGPYQPVEKVAWASCPCRNLRRNHGLEGRATSFSTGCYPDVMPTLSSS